LTNPKNICGRKALSSRLLRPQVPGGCRAAAPVPWPALPRNSSPPSPPSLAAAQCGQSDHTCRRHPRQRSAAHHNPLLLLTCSKELHCRTQNLKCSQRLILVSNNRFGMEVAMNTAQEQGVLDGLLRSEVAIAADVLAHFLLLASCTVSQHFELCDNAVLFKWPLHRSSLACVKNSGTQ
jgi:hypothetical protein